MSFIINNNLPCLLFQCRLEFGKRWNIRPSSELLMNQPSTIKVLANAR